MQGRFKGTTVCIIFIGFQQRCAHAFVNVPVISPLPLNLASRSLDPFSLSFHYLPLISNLRTSASLTVLLTQMATRVCPIANLLSRSIPSL